MLRQTKIAKRMQGKQKLIWGLRNCNLRDTGIWEKTQIVLCLGEGGGAEGF